MLFSIALVRAWRDAAPAYKSPGKTGGISITERFGYDTNLYYGFVQQLAGRVIKDIVQYL